MINSKELQKLAEKLDSVERVIGYLNSGNGCSISVTGQGMPAVVYASASGDEKAVCDLSQQIEKAFVAYRINIERQIQSVVRP